MDTRVLLHLPDLCGVVAPDGPLRDAHARAHVSRDGVIGHADLCERKAMSALRSARQAGRIKTRAHDTGVHRKRPEQGGTLHGST